MGQGDKRPQTVPIRRERAHFLLEPHHRAGTGHCGGADGADAGAMDALRLPHLALSHSIAGVVLKDKPSSILCYCYCDTVEFFLLNLFSFLLL